VDAPPRARGRDLRPEILFAALGVLLVGLGWPLARRRVGPNRWYGLRVPATFADPHVWYEANAVAGRDMVALGVLLVVLAAALPTVAGVRGPDFGVTAAAVTVVGSLFMAVRGWRLANRLARRRRMGTDAT
jgi:membrane protein implicated in regulation of membrane protease activity